MPCKSHPGRQPRVRPAPDTQQAAAYAVGPRHLQKQPRTDAASRHKPNLLRGAHTPDCITYEAKWWLPVDWSLLATRVMPSPNPNLRAMHGGQRHRRSAPGSANAEHCRHIWHTPATACRGLLCRCSTQCHRDVQSALQGRADLPAYHNRCLPTTAAAAVPAAGGSGIAAPKLDVVKLVHGEQVRPRVVALRSGGGTAEPAAVSGSGSGGRRQQATGRLLPPPACRRPARCTAQPTLPTYPPRTLKLLAPTSLNRWAASAAGIGAAPPLAATGSVPTIASKGGAGAAWRTPARMAEA